MASKKALCAERARLIDEKYRDGLTQGSALRLEQIDAELDRLDAPRVTRLKRQTDQEFGKIDQQIVDLTAKIEKHGSGRPQAKTAGSH